MPISRPKSPSVTTTSSLASARIAPACSGPSNEYTAVFSRSIVRMSSTRGTSATIEKSTSMSSPAAEANSASSMTSTSRLRISPLTPLRSMSRYE
jgi:hypothetical protein